MGSPELTCVAVYQRTVAASLERVWENVRDWEHLPWLHRGSFRSIECVDSGPWGWRARVGLQPAATGGEILIELRIEAERLRYVVRTLEGAGQGTEIWTRLDPLDVARTGIAVEFQLPGVAPEAADPLGAAFTRLYTQLWDEDEAMMQRRSAELSRRAASPRGEPDAVSLGSLEQLRTRLPLSVDHAGRRFRVVEVDGVLLAHATVCSHALGPLDEAEVEDGCIRCPWHGYRFDVHTGRSADGRGLRLAPAPRVVVDAESGQVQLLPAAPRRGSQRGTRRQ
jgi:nitrite reductase/ring-hydroxylating ferredoxin subunit